MEQNKNEVKVKNIGRNPFKGSNGITIMPGEIGYQTLHIALSFSDNFEILDTNTDKSEADKIEKEAPTITTTTTSEEKEKEEVSESEEEVEQSKPIQPKPKRTYKKSKTK